MKAVVDYYDGIADCYDTSRFGHEWGQCLDYQERRILEQWLPRPESSDILDLGCGTGRMLDLATAGADASAEMVLRARRRAPSKAVVCSMAHELPFDDATFDAVFSLHLAMHLDHAYLSSVLAECHRILRPGGQIIFDAPSELRRRFNDYQPTGWHCATSMHPSRVRIEAAQLFEWVDFRGLMFAPFHRLPAPATRLWKGVDAAIGRTRLGRWACSHYIFHLRRRDQYEPAR